MPPRANREEIHIPELTVEQVREFERGLLEGYSDPEFQRKLREAWSEADGDPISQGKARQAVCLDVQLPLLKKFGFEASKRGVAHSIKICNRYSQDPELEHINEHLGVLVNPDVQRAHDILRMQQCNLSPEDLASWCLDDLEPTQPLLYGSWMQGVRAPSAFLTLPPSRDLAALATFLQDDPTGPFAGPLDEWPRDTVAGTDGRWWKWSFEVGGEGEGLLKADWHSVHHWGRESAIFVPRAADLVMVPRAPGRILAFLEAFRHINNSCWHRLGERLFELSRRAGADNEGLVWLVNVLIEALKERQLFAAVEAQVWWGDRDVTNRSHKDGATSLLHLSVTLSGRRSVRVGAFESSRATSKDPAKRESVWDDSAWVSGALRKLEMRTGSIYMSSPFIFEHGVCYPACTRQEPIIALQCRWGLSSKQDAQRLNDMRDSDMHAVADVVANTLHEAAERGELRVPTIKEVEEFGVHITLSEGKMIRAKTAGKHPREFRIFW